MYSGIPWDTLGYYVRNWRLDALKMGSWTASPSIFCRRDIQKMDEFFNGPFLQDRQKKHDGKKPMVKTSPAAIDAG